jgi:hypothetical protein
MNASVAQDFLGKKACNNRNLRGDELDQIRYPDKMIDKVRVLSKDSSDNQIVSELNKEGVLSATGKRSSPSMIKCIRYKHQIPGPVSRLPEELTVHQVATRFAVSRNVVYHWIERNVVPARRSKGGAQYWIRLNPQKEKELAHWVKNSVKLQCKRNMDP